MPITITLPLSYDERVALYVALDMLSRSARPYSQTLEAKALWTKIQRLTHEADANA